MSNLRTLIFYATPEHPCSYLPGQQAVTMFVDPKADVTNKLYTNLSQLGFRRSGSHYYKPRCENCNACVPVRIPVEKFRPSRSQKRVWRRNQSLEVKSCQSVFKQEHFEIYQRYITTRHKDGDMYPPTLDQYQSFLLDSRPETRFYEFCENTQDEQTGIQINRTVAIAVTDQIQDGLSAIYTFFDPEKSEAGLGVYAILWQIELAKKLGLPFLYLGYWIRGCKKMSYKIKYRPTEVLLKDHWIVI